jgi:Bifunctional DNA primase/polymerase, N-terminal/Primase C terminal 1 (PriCT-1)
MAPDVPAILAIFRAKGLYIFPVIGKRPLTPHGFKDASSDPHQWAIWAEQFPGCGWAAPTGALNGFDAWDGDTDEGVRWLMERIPLGPRVVTAHGMHFYVRHLTGQRNKVRMIPGVDFRGEGGYVVLAGSPHPSGKPYAYAEGTAELPLPEFRLSLAERSVPPHAAKVIPGQGELIPQGCRNDTLFRLGCHAASRGLDYEAAVRAANSGRCKPPVEDLEIDSILSSIRAYYPTGKPIVPPGFISVGGAAEPTRAACNVRLTKAHARPDGSWDVQEFHANCGVPACPLCYRAWAWNESAAILKRFEMLALVPHHFIVSWPGEASWKAAQAALKSERPRLGGGAAYLHARWEGAECGDARGPHAHLWSPAAPLEPGTREDAGGYTVWWAPEGESREVLDRTLKVALVPIRTSRLDSAIPEETGSTKCGHTVKWLGDLSYNKKSGSGRAAVRKERTERGTETCKTCREEVPSSEWFRCTVLGDLPDGVGNLPASKVEVMRPVIVDRTAGWGRTVEVRAE